MTEFEAVKYFTEIAVQLNAAILGLFSLHATVLVGAVGWAITQRSHPKGLSVGVLPVVALALGAFFAVNLLSLDGLYTRLNAALAVLERYWNSKPGYDEVMVIFRPAAAMETHRSWLDYLSSWQLIAAFLDTVVIAFVCVLLSNAGRSSRS